jgi:hypothetical protein
LPLWDQLGNNQIIEGLLISWDTLKSLRLQGFMSQLQILLKFLSSIRIYKNRKVQRILFRNSINSYIVKEISLKSPSFDICNSIVQWFSRPSNKKCLWLVFKTIWWQNITGTTKMWRCYEYFLARPNSDKRHWPYDLILEIKNILKKLLPQPRKQSLQLKGLIDFKIIARKTHQMGPVTRFFCPKKSMIILKLILIDFILYNKIRHKAPLMLIAQFKIYLRSPAFFGNVYLYWINNWW